MNRPRDRMAGFGEHGSLTVELILLTPVLFLLVVCTVLFGRVTASRQQVIEAARAGAQSAAVSPTVRGAAGGATAAAAAGLVDPAHTCAHQTVETDVRHFQPGGFVTVTVTCDVALSDLAVPGMPGSVALRASATAPIDPYRSVG